MQTNLIFSTETWTAMRIVGSPRQVVLCMHLSSERMPLVLFAPKVLLRCSGIYSISSDVFSSSASTSTAYDSFSIISSVPSLCLALSFFSLILESTRLLFEPTSSCLGCLNSCCSLYSLTFSVCWIFLVSSSMTSYGYLTNLRNLINRL
jgi:hypothetical protein